METPQSHIQSTCSLAVISVITAFHKYLDSHFRGVIWIWWLQNQSVLLHWVLLRYWVSGYIMASWSFKLCLWGMPFRNVGVFIVVAFLQIFLGLHPNYMYVCMHNFFISTYTHNTMNTMSCICIYALLSDNSNRYNDIAKCWSFIARIFSQSQNL